MRSIATRTGDDGTTSLLYGQRVPKDHPQIEAVGAFDELNVALGAIKPHLTAALATAPAPSVAVSSPTAPNSAPASPAALSPTPSAAATLDLLVTTQKNLVALMGEIACAESDATRYADSKFEKLTEADLTRLDTAVAALEARGLKFDGWATPGANARAAAFDTARVTARRAERRLCSLPAHGRTVRPVVRHFVNRLSDLLWLLAREAEQ